MAAGKEFPLSLVVRAVDKATGPLRAITARLKTITAPFKKLGGDVGGLGEALNLEGFRKVGDAARGVGGAVLGLGAKFATLAAGGTLAFASLIHGAEQAGSRLADTADRVGLTVDAYASLEFAAKRSGVEQAAFSGAMDKLNQHLGEMTAGKGGAFLAFLNTVSPTLAKQMKAAKGTEAALSLLTDAFAKIDNPAKSAVLASQAFGKSGLQMGRFLNQGRGKVQELQAEFIRLSGSSEAFARNASAMGDATDNLETAFTGLRNTIAGALFPAVSSLVTAVTNFLVKNRDGLEKWAKEAGAALQAWVDGGGFERLVASLKSTADAIGRVVEFLGPMGIGIGAAVVATAPLIASVFSLGGALIGVAPQIFAAGVVLKGFAVSAIAAAAPLAPFILAGGALAYLGKTIYDNWGDITYLFSNFGETLKISVLGAWEAVRPVLEKLGGFFGGNNAFTAALRVGEAATGMLGPIGGVSAARPPPPSISQSEARVSVDFSNLPAGARVSTAPNSSQPVDLSMGYSMAVP